MRSPQPARRLARGVTLVEVLVVVAIMSLLAAGVGIAAYRYWKQAQIRVATTSARTIRDAVPKWWLTTGQSGCPTFAELVRRKILDADSPRLDPWGKPWRIECTDDEVSVSSDGPDRTPSTEDDIRVPPLSKDAASATPDDSS